MEGTFKVIWSLVKPYLEAHDLKQTLPLKLGTLGLWGQEVTKPNHFTIVEAGGPGAKWLGQADRECVVEPKFRSPAKLTPPTIPLPLQGGDWL